MKNSLIVIGILFIQLFMTARSALANVTPYLNEVRNAEEIMETENLCTTRRIMATNFLKNLNQEEEKEVKNSRIASN